MRLVPLSWSPFYKWCKQGTGRLNTKSLSVVTQPVRGRNILLPHRATSWNSCLHTLLLLRPISARLTPIWHHAHCLTEKLFLRLTRDLLLRNPQALQGLTSPAPQRQSTKPPPPSFLLPFPFGLHGALLSSLASCYSRNFLIAWPALPHFSLNTLSFDGFHPSLVSDFIDVLTTP